jgi:hypothetical protein
MPTVEEIISALSRFIGKQRSLAWSQTPPINPWAHRISGAAVQVCAQAWHPVRANSPHSELTRLGQCATESCADAKLKAACLHDHIAINYLLT